MFEFITVSNGVAVVQHGATGHVYRFRPAYTGVWSRLALDRVDVCQTSSRPPEAGEDAARFFAENALPLCWALSAENGADGRPPPARDLRRPGEPNVAAGD